MSGGHIRFAIVNSLPVFQLTYVTASSACGHITVNYMGGE